MKKVRFFIDGVEHFEDEIIGMDNITHIIVTETITKSEFKEQFPNHPLNKEVYK